MRSLLPRVLVLAQLHICGALPLDASDADDAPSSASGDCLLQSSSHSHKSALQTVVEALVEDASHVAEKDSAQAETLLTGSSALEDAQAVADAQKAQGAAAAEAAQLVNGKASATVAEATTADVAVESPKAAKAGADAQKAQGAAAAEAVQLANISASATDVAAEASKVAQAPASQEPSPSPEAGDGKSLVGTAEAAIDGPKAIKDVAPALLAMEDASRLHAEHERTEFALDDAALARKNQTFQIGDAGLRLHIGSVPERSFFTVEGKDCLQPTKGDKLLVHYTGTLKDGAIFDSSYKRDEPFLFTIGEGRVLKGWDEGLLSMCLGERGSLHVPAAFAYGKDGALPRIPKDADLDFDVELLAINEVSAPQYHRPKIHMKNPFSGSKRTGGSLLWAVLSYGLTLALRA